MWRNGPVEAQVNGLQRQKRQLFGRANSDLLRLRVLRRAYSVRARKPWTFKLVQVKHTLLHVRFTTWRGVLVSD